MGKYTLIVTEKPEAARRIAQALDKEGEPEEFKRRGVPCLRAFREGELVVVPALGHLYTVVHERGGRNYYPVFSFEWAPRHLAERGAKQVKAWIEVFSEMAENADSFIDACDYDLEGSLIGYCVLKYACGGKEGVAKRMKYSTLTKRELEKAYAELLPGLDFGLIKAGETRHEVDWLYGINLSRALTLAAQRLSRRYTTLSTGRVQGPSLRFMVEREREILCFVPAAYWDIVAEVEIGGSAYEVEYEREKLGRRAEADAVVRACEGKAGEIKEVELREFQERPPTPFDIGTLQTEAYRHFGYTPRQTLDIAQRLYLQALISYPRTSSQKLPPVIDYRVILSSLSRGRDYEDLAAELLKRAELTPHEGEKEDPAHPAVYPTGSLPEAALSGPERKVLDLVVRRFMAVFGDPAVRQSMRVSIEVNGHLFYLRGRRILKEGWMRFYGPYVSSDEVLLPPLRKGDTVRLRRVTRQDKFTKPPPRYNPSSLLKKMEDEGIGTKATRADIIQTLYDRGYIRGRSITVTGLGFDVTEVLSGHCPSVVSVELTRGLEEKMELIQNGGEKRENVLLEAVEQLRPVLEGLKEDEEAIGEALSEALRRARMEERIVGPCPDCGTGSLMIIYSRRTGKRFIGCTNYFKNACRTSFPLPQKGTVRPAQRECGACGWPQVEVRMMGRRPWILCFNPRCPRKEERRP